VRRFFSDFGSRLKVDGFWHVSGPQEQDQLPGEVVALLDRDPAVTAVVVLRGKENEWGGAMSVSYTHLTLPTICSV